MNVLSLFSGAGARYVFGATIHARRENEAARRAHYRALQQDRTTADR